MTRGERRKLEIRDRILAAAYESFVRDGVAATSIELICERADVANRTFFNHFPTRQSMLRALAERRLSNLQTIIENDAAQPLPSHLVELFDTIAAELTEAGDAYREVVGAMVGASGYGVVRGSTLHDGFVQWVKNSAARGEISAHQAPEVLADIVAGALTGAIVNWTADPSYQLAVNMHEIGVSLARIFADPNEIRRTR
jgi:AcrR family transcriptional regulator